MSETVERVDALTALAVLHRDLDVLSAALTHLDAGSDDTAVSAIREFERLRRRLESVDHALLIDVEQRGIPSESGLRSTANWLRAAVLVDIHEANARVRAARAAGPRRSLLGQVLPARFPVVAAAQASGELGAKQARVITSMLDKLPAAVIEQVPVVEARLVGFCASLDAGLLQRCAVQEQAWLDPDGGYREVERRRRDRDVRFTQRPDGSCAGSLQGTVELGEFLQVTFDALLDALRTAVGSGSLPLRVGLLATVVLTMTEESYRDGTGFAITGHNAQVSPGPGGDVLGRWGLPADVHRPEQHPRRCRLLHHPPVVHPKDNDW